MSQENLEIVKRAYAAFNRGDVPTVLQMFAERLEHFEVVSDARSKAPWHVPGRTREDVGTYFNLLVGALEPMGLEYEHLAAGGDYVYATTRQQFRVRKTGKPLTMRCSIHRFKIVEGRFVGWLAMEDTALTREALDG